MLPRCRARKILDHRPEILFQELSHFFRFECFHQFIQELVGVCARLYRLTLVLCVSRALGHKVKVLVIELVKQVVSFCKLYHTFILCLVNVAVKKFLHENEETN